MLPRPMPTKPSANKVATVTVKISAGAKQETPEQEKEVIQQEEQKIEDSPEMVNEGAKLMDEVEIKITEMDQESPEELSKEPPLELIKRATLELPYDKDYESAVESELDHPQAFIVPKKKKTYAIKYRVI